MRWQARFARWLAPHAFYGLEQEAREHRQKNLSLIIQLDNAERTIRELKVELDLRNRVSMNFQNAVGEAQSNIERLFAYAYGHLNREGKAWVQVNLGLPLTALALNGNPIHLPEPKDVYSHPELGKAFEPRAGETPREAYERGAVQLFHHLDVMTSERL